MFNFFSKKETPVTETKVAELPTTKTGYPSVVDEIHNKFFTAGENILAEAEVLLKQLETKDLDKGKRLAALGFEKTREAIVAIETENKLATTKEIADLVMYYRVNYPDNKFITEQQVKQVCEKYGLFFGEIGLFKGFVPENKLTMIESFFLKNEDKFDLTTPTYFVTSDNGTDDWKPINISESDFKSKSIKNYINSSYHYVEHVCPRLNNGKGKVVSHLAQPKLVSGKNKLQICAPLKDMETVGVSVKDYKLFDKIEVPDPVVLQPVNGGYLIVCAWGDEASD